MLTRLKICFKIVLTLLVFGGLAALPSAHGQAANDRPINVVIPFAPGGGTDVLTRMVMPKVAEKLGVGTIIENRPGAAGAIGAQFVARANPDGKTLLVGSVSEIGVNPSIYPKLPYNVERDFVAVTALAAAPMVLVVHPSSEVKVAGDLVKLAKANPGKINFGSAGTGSGAHMAAELFIFETQIKLTHVPYKGTAPAMTDLMSNSIQILVDAPSGVGANIRAGKIKALAFFSDKRLSSYPDVPTIVESGGPKLESSSWVMFFAPAGTSMAIVNKLSLTVKEALKSEELIKRFEEQGILTVGNTPAEADTFLRAEIAKWGNLIKTVGVKAE